MLYDESSDTQSLIKDFSKGAFVWYNFRPDSSILYIYNQNADEAVLELLESKGIVAVCSAEKLLSKQYGCEAYDYIVGIDIIEESRESLRLLKLCHALLKKDGRMLIGAENRYAVKYICGDRDPYTNHNFDGIENYRRLSDADRDSIAGRCYSMAELKSMFLQAGFVNDKFYSVMPSLQETQLVYAEGYEPVEELATRYFPLYNYPDSVFLEEQYLYTDLIKNGMFHKMANAYIIECSMDGQLDDTLHATISLDRGHDNALVTSICEHDGVRNVIKRAVYKEGIHKLKEMQDNLNDLHARGINVVDSSVENNTFIMPYVDAPVAMNELKAIAKKDRNAFFKAMDDMYELILDSSEHTGVLSEKDRNSADGRDVGPVLARGYIDMVPLNCFYDESAKDAKSRFIYYDQEFYWENCPAKAVMYRSITIIYDGTDKEFERIVPRRELFDRYGLSECEDMWQRMSSRFTDVLRNQKPLRPYYENKRVDGRILYTNREKINYSAKQYQEIFVDIFERFDDSKKLILFGSGRFTEKFLFQFADDYDIYSIIDNNSAKWGTTMQGVPINSPDILKDIPERERHIIICIKGYNGVVNQLKDMGIKAEPNLGEILFEMTMNEGAEYIQKKYNLNLTTEEICTGINNRVYKFYEKEAMPKPKVIDFIEQAYENKIPMTIATSTDRPMIEAAFKRLHIDKYFKKIFTTTEVGHGKDKPDIFIKAMEEMETTPKQTWLFEDGAYSIETAKQLGIKTIGIYDPASEKDQEKIRNLTNIYIKNWTENKTLLKQIQNNK